MTAKRPDCLFVCTYPAGLVYTDCTRSAGGDYKGLAFLSFSTLKLRLEHDCPADLAAWIEQDAATLQRRHGERYTVSTCGQTVILGG